MASQSTRRSAANPYVTGGPSRYLQTKGGTSSIPSTGIRTGGTISVGGAPSAKAGSSVAKIPTGGEPGDPTNISEAYNPIIDAETENAPIDPNRQETIANQARVPRFSVGNPRVGNIDLGSLLSAKSTEGFDPNAPIGGANVPFQETKGVGGFFRRMFGDTANEQNVAAQQTQGAEWKRDAALDKQRQAKRQDLAEEIRLREEGPTKRFEAEQKRLTDKEINDEIERNNAIDLALLKEGNEGVLKDVDMVRKARSDEEDRALKERQVKIAEDAYNNPAQQAVHDPKGNVLFYNPKTGRPTGTFRQPNFGMVTDPNDPKKQIMGTTPGGYEAIGPSGSANEPQVTGFGDSYVNGLDASGNKFGKLPPPPKPAAAVTPARSAAPGEQGEEVRGLLPSVGDYLGSGESPVSLSQDAPVTAQNREGFMAGLGDLGRSVSESARSIKPLMLGGRLPRYTPEQGGGVLGMMLNAPGAAMSPVEAGVNSVLRNTKNSYNSMFGDDSGASMAVPNKLQDPNALYMSDKEYKNYLRSKRLTE